MEHEENQDIVSEDRDKSWEKIVAEAIQEFKEYFSDFNLAQELQAELDDGLAASRELLPEADIDGYKKAIEYARTVSDFLFRKNIESQGLKNELENPELHPQEKINWLLSPETKIFFDEEGQPVSLFDWIKKHFFELEIRGQGFSMEIDFQPVSQISDKVTKSLLQDERSAHVLETLNTLNIPVPILTLQYVDETRYIPILLTWFPEGKIDHFGQHTYKRDVYDQTYDHLIEIVSSQTSAKSDGSILLYPGHLIHEIDHAVTNLFYSHHSRNNEIGHEIKKIVKEIDSLNDQIFDLEKAKDSADDNSERAEILHRLIELSLQMRQLESRKSSLKIEAKNKRHAKRFSRKFADEGLATQMEDVFLEEQLKGFATFYKSEQVVERMQKLLRLNMTDKMLSSFENLELAPYNAGLLLISFLESRFDQGTLLETNFLDKEIFSKPEIMIFLLNYLLKQHQKMRKIRNNVRDLEIPVESLHDAKVLIRSSVSGDASTYFLDQQYYDLMKETERELDQLDDSQIYHQFYSLTDYSEENKRLADICLEAAKGDFKKALWSLLIKLRSNHLMQAVWDKIFEDVFE